MPKMQTNYKSMYRLPYVLLSMSQHMSKDSGSCSELKSNVCFNLLNLKYNSITSREVQLKKIVIVVVFIILVI